MITPSFKLSQDDNHVHFCLRIPYASLKELEVSVEDEIFVFTCKPYHLRLHLPGKLTDEYANTSFDADSGKFKFSMRKANSGEYFDDLDLVTKLLCPKIEVVEGERKITVLTSSVTQTIVSKDNTEGSKEYGFAMLGNFNLKGLVSEFNDVLEVDPLEVTLEERKRLRIQYEQGKFNVEHYLADLFDTESFYHLLELESPWSKSCTNNFTDEELDLLKDLQNIEYKLTEKETKYCFNSLIDILFAYCYEQRTTYFEGNVESGWTIVKLSASLSWFDGFNTPKEALISAYRRSVIYPLYRNFALCEKVFADLKQVLDLGEKCIIKCLINIHKIFLTGYCSKYILNDLFIKHYIRYAMKWDKEAWKKIVSDVKETVIKKEDLGLNLKEIEDNGSLECMMSSLQIVEYDSDDSSDSSSDSDTSTYSSTCSDSSEVVEE